MMITTEGVNIDPEIEKLQEGDGFIVLINTSWRVSKNKDNLEAIKDANTQGLLGRIYNGQKDTPSEVMDVLTTEIPNFWTEINTIIDNHNQQSS